MISAWPVIGQKAGRLQPQKVKMAMPMRTGKTGHSRWDEIQARHFNRLARSLPDPDLWSKMLDTARSVPMAIAAVEKLRPADLKQSVWTLITGGIARKAQQFLRDAESLSD